MKITRHYFRTIKYEVEGSWWLYLGSLAVSIYLLAGRWISLGIHISIVPLYVDIHFLWFVISIMSLKRAQEFYDGEEAYLEAEREVVQYEEEG